MRPWKWKSVTCDGEWPPLLFARTGGDWGLGEAEVQGKLTASSSWAMYSTIVSCIHGAQDHMVPWMQQLPSTAHATAEYVARATKYYSSQALKNCTCHGNQRCASSQLQAREMYSHNAKYRPCHHWALRGRQTNDFQQWAPCCLTWLNPMFFWCMLKFRTS